MCAGGLDFWAVLFLVAPLAERFKVGECVVEEVAVFVMDLHLACFTAAFAGVMGIVPSCPLSSGETR